MICLFGSGMTVSMYWAPVELFAASKIIKSGPSGHQNCSDRSCDERKTDRVLIKLASVGEKTRWNARDDWENGHRSFGASSVTRCTSPLQDTLRVSLYLLE